MSINWIILYAQRLRSRWTSWRQFVDARLFPAYARVRFPRINKNCQNTVFSSNILLFINNLFIISNFEIIRFDAKWII